MEESDQESEPVEPECLVERLLREGSLQKLQVKHNPKCEKKVEVSEGVKRNVPEKKLEQKKHMQSNRRRQRVISISR